MHGRCRLFTKESASFWVLLEPVSNDSEKEENQNPHMLRMIDALRNDGVYSLMAIRSDSLRLNKECAAIRPAKGKGAGRIAETATHLVMPSCRFDTIDDDGLAFACVLLQLGQQRRYRVAANSLEFFESLIGHTDCLQWRATGCLHRVC